MYVQEQDDCSRLQQLHLETKSKSINEYGKELAIHFWG